MPLICLCHSSQKKVTVHFLKGVSVVLDWWGWCSERSRPPLVGYYDSKHVISRHLLQLTCPCPYTSLEYTSCPLPLWEGDGAKWKKKSSPFSPWKLPDVHLFFLKCLSLQHPAPLRGQWNPKSVCILMELRTANMGNISVTHQFSVVTGSLGRTTSTSFPGSWSSQTCPVMGVPEESWFPYLRHEEVFPKPHTGCQPTWVSTHRFSHNY